MSKPVLKAIVAMASNRVIGKDGSLTGFGGGMLLSLALAPWLGPASALAVSSPALALGHLHRVHVYRPLIDREITRRFALAAGPAAVAGGLPAGVSRTGRRDVDRRGGHRSSMRGLAHCRSGRHQPRES